MPSTPIAQIRSITQDKPYAQLESIATDGVQKTLQLKYFPMDPSSFVITPAAVPTSVNAETGLVSWAAAPGAATQTVNYNSMVLSDQSIQDMIDVETVVSGDGTYDIRLAAADCLDAIASNQALVLKMIHNMDLETDGPAVAKSLRDHADTLRKLVYDPAYQDIAFDFAEQINDKPGFAEKVQKDWMRDST